MQTTQLIIETPPSVVVPVGDSRAEAFRYLVASVAALAIDAALLWVGVRAFGIVPWIAGAIAYGVGLVSIYFLSVRWVFGRRTVANPTGEFVIFAALGLIGLLVNSATLYLLTGAGVALVLAKTLSAAIGFCVNFVSRKAILFSGRRR